ncbi:IS5 family transposase (plasmid) [Sinorhizobium kummerowiae]|uniref:Transposase n=1 Tax=Sinorhizobium kummerowiae TaxID=158892 RepID=A0ABY8TEW1_9HYPH|nr:IS5 family transposase [Sinorhizobium kummerowiae]WHS96337.1 transposase [Sinorhizobium kummerowiae]WQH41717.1 IS5 family transposase [Sinorhizobium kummerowiae]
MRGGDVRTGELFSYVDLEDRVRKDHPLRAIRQIVNDALVSLERDFAALYSPIGRPSIAPEKLLRAMLLQAFYSIRSERLLMERLEYDLLFRWFVDFGIDDPAWDHSVFSKNRDRLLDGDIAAKFLGAILSQPKVKRLLSTDHFSVDGTLVEAWASMKSFKPKDGPRGDNGEPPSDSGGRNAGSDFHGERRSNETHASTTDPDRPQAITLGADKAYDTKDSVKDLRSIKVTPHVTQNINGRRSAIDGRTTRHCGYKASLRIRKRIEEAFGWIKTVAGQDKTKFRGRDRVGWAFTFAAAAYNLVRLPKLMTETG